jgi:predicted  nucleic acid-binding Zn-ribbon protein
MKIDENIDPKIVSDYSGARKNESGIGNNKNISGKEEFKKGVRTTSVIGAIILVVIGIVVYSLYNRQHKMMLSQMESQQNTFTENLSARDSVIVEWVTTFSEIERNIAMIKEKENIISMNSSNNELSKDKRLQVLDDIQYINTLLEANKQKIASLTEQLKKSGGKIKILEHKIAELEESVKLSEIEISDLKNTLVSKNFEIDQLNTQNSELQSTIVQKEETITKQTNEMNKAFYAIGTTKELKAKGLLTKKGGFIGLGKTKSISGNLSDSAFVQVDISKTKFITVNSKKAKLISEHPVNSYQFIRDKNNKIETLEIRDPAQFWKISKYAVVQVTK